MRRLVFDIEANGLLKPTPESPAITKVHCLVIKDIDTKEVFRFRPEDIARGVAMLMEADLLIGHNIIGYDLFALQMVYPEFTYDRTKVIDTLVLARLLFPNIADLDYERVKRIEPKECGSHRLKAWGQRLGVFKIDFDGGWEVFTEEMLEYCVGDVDVSEALYYHLIDLPLDPRASELEHAVDFICTQQSIYGFPFDLAKAQALTQQLQGRLAELDEELRKVFKPWFEVDGEPKRAAYESEAKGWWGYRVNHRMDLEYAKSSPFDEQPPTELLRYKAGANKGQLKRSKEKSDFLGYRYQNIKLIEFNPASNQHIIKRLKALYNWKHISTEVTKTGQPKVDDTILNRLPYPEAKLLAEFKMVQKRLGLLMGKDEDKGWLNVYREESGQPRVHGEIIANGAVTGRGTHKIIANIPRVTTPYGLELRELFGASAGRVQVGIDVSGLELRMLAHFLAKFDYGAYGITVCEGDIHTLNQIAAGLKTRDQAKTFIYAFLYGGGDVKIGSIAFPGATEAVQRREGKKLKATFVAKTPGLDRLLEQIKAAAGRGYLSGLDGRKIVLRSDHSALNFLLQGAGSLLCKRWMVILDEDIRKRNWHNIVQQLIWYHDELQFDVVPEYADEFGRLAVECIAKAGEYFGIRVPLTGEYKIGRNWRECH